MDKKYNQKNDSDKNKGPDLQDRINAMLRDDDKQNIDQTASETRPQAQERRAPRMDRREETLESKKKNARSKMRRVPQNRREMDRARRNGSRRPARRDYRRSQDIRRRSDRWRAKNQGGDPLMEGFKDEDLSHEFPDDVCETMPEERGGHIPGLGIRSAGDKDLDARERPKQQRRRAGEESYKDEHYPNMPDDVCETMPEERGGHIPGLGIRSAGDKDLDAEEKPQHRRRRAGAESYKDEHYPDMPDDVCETMPEERGGHIPGLGIRSAGDKDLDAEEKPQHRRRRAGAESYKDEHYPDMPDDVCETMPEERGGHIPGLGIRSAGDKDLDAEGKPQQRRRRAGEESYKDEHYPDMPDDVCETMPEERGGHIPGLGIRSAGDKDLDAERKPQQRRRRAGEGSYKDEHYPDMPDDVCETMPEERGGHIPGLGIRSAGDKDLDAEGKPQQRRRRAGEGSYKDEHYPDMPDDVCETMPEERGGHIPGLGIRSAGDKDLDAEGKPQQRRRRAGAESYKDEHYPDMPDDVCETMPEERGGHIPGLGIRSAGDKDLDAEGKPQHRRRRAGEESYKDEHYPDMPDDVCETMPEERGGHIPGLGIRSAGDKDLDAERKPQQRRRRAGEGSYKDEHYPDMPDDVCETMPEERGGHIPGLGIRSAGDKDLDAEGKPQQRRRRAGAESYKDEHYPDMPDDVCETMPDEKTRRIPGLGIRSAEETASESPEEVQAERKAAGIHRKRPSAFKKAKKKPEIEENGENLLENKEGQEEAQEGPSQQKKARRVKRRVIPVDDDQRTEDLPDFLTDQAVDDDDVTRKVDREEIDRLEAQPFDEEYEEDEDIEEDLEEPEEEKESGFKRFARNWLEPIIIAIALALIINIFLGGAALVKGESMEPTLHNKEVLIVSKIPTYTGNFKRSDIVIIDSPDKQDEYYVKRIVGLPGEKVDIVDGHVFINEKLLKEYYIDDLPTEVYQDSSWKLGADEYFVLGDNRKPGASNDSRLFGPVKKDHLEEVARFRIFPFSKIRSFY